MKSKRNIKRIKKKRSNLAKQLKQQWMSQIKIKHIKNWPHTFTLCTKTKICVWTELSTASHTDRLMERTEGVSKAVASTSIVIPASNTGLPNIAFMLYSCVGCNTVSGSLCWIKAACNLWLCKEIKDIFWQRCTATLHKDVAVRRLLGERVKCEFCEWLKIFSRRRDGKLWVNIGSEGGILIWSSQKKLLTILWIWSPVDEVPGRLAH